MIKANDQIDLRRKLIDEIYELLADNSNSLVPILQKAARLANLCDETDLLTLFEYHLDGMYHNKMSKVMGTHSPRLTNIKAKMSDEIFNMYAHDRARPKGTIQAHSIVKLEQILSDLRKPPPNEENILMADEIDSIFERIRNRTSACVRSIEKNLVNINSATHLEERKGKIFLGHGRSQIWRDLKDFLQDRLKLDWDEFNRESTPGLATKERLEEMLQDAGFAFLIMTAEDEHGDKTIHARENVIHEIGLFQGKLGFRKAIVLLEEGCQEFSNIIGLTQIRFPKGNIKAEFEEVRRVLEREGILINKF